MVFRSSISRAERAVAAAASSVIFRNRSSVSITPLRSFDSAASRTERRRAHAVPYNTLTLPENGRR